ncbi:MAG: peptidoglycan binding domain-containing protein [Patescibacteria group bacterium]
MKSEKVLFLTIAALFLVLLGMAGALFSYQKVYAGKIYKNVIFADIDLSGKTKKQAETLLSSKFRTILGTEILLRTPEKEVRANLADTGLTFNIEEAINSGYSIGRTGSFLDSLIASTKTFFTKSTLSVAPRIDQKSYNDFLEIAVAQLNSEPSDATLAIDNGEVKSTAAKSGQVVDTSALADQIVSAAGNGQTEIILTSRSKDAKVQNADFDNAISQANYYLNKKIVLANKDKKFIPTKNEIGNWITFSNNNGQIAANLDDSNIKAYLNKIGAQFVIKKVDRKINSADGAVITEGVEGLYIDADKTLAALKSQMIQPTVNLEIITRSEEPKEIKVATAEGLTAGRYEGKYIDIDLANQKLCRVEGPNLIDCFIISSGKPSMPTPTGEFHITSKNPKQWSGKYGLWMPYWQQFSGDYGIHELPEWPNGYKEGESHLGTPVSHGCVRLGIGSAQTVFDWTDIGTTVYIHK